MTKRFYFNEALKVIYTTISIEVSFNSFSDTPKAAAV